MVRSSKGLRAGTRRKLSKEFRGKFTVTPYLRKLNQDDKVVIKQNPSSHKGMPHIRFKGLTGIVKGKRGNSYIVEVKVGSKIKTIMSRPEHLKPVAGV
jgi:large subunit ribosomal protein L21e